jgi:putative ABC transport system permease protein
VIIANVRGRRYEYGVLRAVGAQRGVLLRLILAEAALLALAGAIAGTAAGLHLAWVANIHYRHLLGLDLTLALPTGVAVAGWSILAALTLLAALPGALMVIRPTPSALVAGGRGN